MIRKLVVAWPTPARVGLALALCAATLVAACESVKVVAPDAVRVEVNLTSQTLLPDGTVQLVARVFDADGNALVRTVQWTTSNSAVATVNSSGLVRAVTAGTATITASVGGRSATTIITVVQGPAIAVDPGTIGFNGTVNGGTPATQTVSVTNAGAGTLRDLSVTVTYVGGGSGWLNAVLTTTTAPAQLRLSVELEDLDPGTYQATVAVASPGANNSPRTVQVALDVSDVPPSIGLIPASVGFGAIEGEGDPNPREVTITNEGAGVLDGLAVETDYTAGTGGWLETTLAEPTAPTTLTLQPRTGDLPEGVYLAAVRVSSPNAANSPQNVSVTFTVGEPPPTDVSVSKTGPDEVDAVDNITYDIVVVNHGPALAVGVVVTDELPEGVEFVSASGGGALTGNSVTWPTIPSVVVGDTVRYTVTVTAPPSGDLLNVVSSTATASDPNPGNNDGSAEAARVTTEVHELADVELFKTGPDSVDAAAEFTYTIEVKNNGPSSAIEVAVTDVLPPEATFVSASDGGVLDGGVVKWPAIDTLTAGNARTLQVTVKAPANAPPGGELLNVVASEAETEDRVPENNDGTALSNQAITAVVNQADLAVTKTADADTVTAGEQLTYTIEITNNGPSDATDVEVEDILPSGLSHDSDNASQGNYNSATGVWLIGDVPTGGTETLIMVVDVSPAAADSVINEATVSSPDEDPDDTNDVATVVTVVERSADLAVTKSASVDSIAAGGQFTYVVTVTNDGPSSATQVVANESLPAEVSIVGANATQGTFNQGTQVWAVGTLTPGQSETLAIVVAVDLAGADTLENTVDVDATEDDPDASNDDASVETVVLYSVGGTVTGLAGSGLVLQNNGGDNLPVTGNGSFTFPTTVIDGTAYGVSVLTQPTNLAQTCTVTNGSGTVTSANVTNVTVTCVTDTFSVGGTVSGLGGSGLVLRNNGGDNLAVPSNGAFTFSTEVTDGTGYDVTVLTNPTNLAQTCTVANASGTMAGADVTNVAVTCVTDAFDVGGTVTGLAGSGLVLRNNGGDNLSVAANGSFTFATGVVDGTGYNVTVLTQPTNLSQTCTVTSGSGTMAGADVTSVNVTCVTNTFSVGGTASGLAPGNSVVLQNNGGDNETVASNGGFTFDTDQTDGTSYSVSVLTQPTTPSQTCTVSNGNGTLSGADVTNVNVTCVTDTFSVGGTVTGLVGAGLVLRNNGADSEAIAANGSFTFNTELDDATAYNVTVFAQPSTPSQTCVVSNGSGTLNGANVTNVSVSCTTDSFTVGGTVSGLAAGNSVVLRNNGVDNEPVAGNGSFTFDTALLDLSPYNVTVFTQPTTPSQTCTVSNGSGNLAGSNVTNVSVACVTDQFTVGGTVSGLAAGNSVVLRTGTENETVAANGAFTFNTALDDQSPYAVTVFTQPTTPSQTCVVSSGSGTLNGANVTNVAVSCTTDSFTVGGTVSGLAPGNTVTLQNNGGDNVVEGNGPFTFPAALLDLSAYSVTVFTQPTTPSQTCTVSNGSGNLAGGNVTNVSVACVTDQFTVGGTVSGLAAGNSVVLRTGPENETVAANGAFTFNTALDDQSPYAVTVFTQPTTPSQTCVVSSGSGTLNAANVTNVSVTCTTDTFTVGGTVSGLAAGNSVVLRNNGGDAETVAANGAFTFDTALLDQSPYAVTVFTQPTTPSQTCTVTNGSGNLAGSNVTNVSVACVTDQFTVGGTVSGLAAGNSVVLRNNGTDNETVAANGAFTFNTALDDQSPYAVSVFAQPTTPSQTCVVSSGSGTLNAANVTNVSVTCTTDSFTVGGSVSGLAVGNTVTLLNNGGDNIVRGNGAFTFPTALLDENTYAVTVLTQPTTPNQVCTVTNGSGTLAGANVTNVAVTCATVQYTIGGTVSGLAAGNSVVLRNNGGDDELVSANGAFTFDTALNDGSPYAVTVPTQPTTPSQTCTVFSGGGTLAGANVSSVSVVCVTDTFTVGGTVSGLAAGNTVTLQNNGGNSTVVTQASPSFTFPAQVDEGAYDVTVFTQPSIPSQTCTVTNGSGNLAGANVTNVSVACVTDQFTVGGSVSGLAAGNTVTLRNNGGDDLVTANGVFTFATALNDGSSYAVSVFAQPTTPSQTCTVSSGTGNLAGGNVNSVFVACVTDTFTVGGTVSGLASGNSVVLRNNGADDETVSANGSYTFDTALLDETGYTVTVFTQPTSPNQTCTVSNGTSTLAGANVTNVNVSCVTTTYTVGGTVSGLAAGNSVTLRNNGGDDVVTANGGFTFPTALNDGSSYAVTVFTQPTTPSQTCTVTAGSGNLAGANVTNVGVNCVTNTFTVGGTVSGLAAGNSVVLRNNGGDDETVSANGSYAFNTALADESPYAVTVFSQPTSPNQVCTVSNGGGTLAGGNVTNVNVSCSTTTYTVGGTVTGLAAGNSVVLRNNGVDNETVGANGGFTFDTPLNDGSGYAVSVFTQPTTPSQTCTVTNGSGNLAGANVTNVGVTCVTDSYTVGGTVSGLASGNTVTLQNNGGDNIAEGNGPFTFPAALLDENAYAVTVLTQPTTPNQVCTVSNGSGTLAGANVTNVSVSCVTDAHTVGGTVSGLAAGNSLVLRNNGGDDETVIANGSFTFDTALNDGSTYAVTVFTQPTAPSQTCTVSGGSGTLAGANVTTVSVSCATNTFTVGGTVSGLVGTGLVLQNNAGDDEAITANGGFTFATALLDETTYAVTVLTQPTGPTQICSVTNGGGTLAAANVTNVSVTCTTNQFTVGGTVTGLAAGNSVVLQNNGGDDETVTADGSFTFATSLNDGAAYAVTVLTQPTAPNQTCTVSTGTGNLAGANVTNVTVTCVTDQFTVGGTVSGLNGTGLVLQNNGGDDLAVGANGAFTFATALDDGTGYGVTVLTQPSAPAQTCTVTSGGGTLAGANVTGVSVSCVDD